MSTTTKRTRDRYTWLRQIKVDPTLRPSVFKTAYEITQYVNDQTGEFRASPKTIARGGDWSDGIAMSASMVEEDFAKLEAAGFLECVERGKRGRGHSSRFRIILKSQPSGIFQPAKIPVSAPENPGLPPLKSRPSGMNLIEPILNLRSASRPAPSNGAVAQPEESRPTKQALLAKFPELWAPPPPQPTVPIRTWQAGEVPMLSEAARRLIAPSSA